MAKEKNWTADRVKAIVKKAIKSRSDEVSISDVSMTLSGYCSVELSGDIFTDELNEISRGVCDRLISVSAIDADMIQLYMKPGNHDPKEFDDDDDEQEPEDEDRMPRIPDNMRHTDQFPDSEDIIIPGTEVRRGNTEQNEQIMAWMAETGHTPIVYIRLEDGVHVEVSELFDRKVKAVLSEGRAVGGDGRKYTFDKPDHLFPVGSDICTRATCEETGRSDVYGLTFFV